MVRIIEVVIDSHSCGGREHDGCSLDVFVKFVELAEQHVQTVRCASQGKPLFKMVCMRCCL